MSFKKVWDGFKAKLRASRPFLRTKTGSRLGIFCILDFLILFFAPLLHGFVGAAIFGCVASVFLVLMWRRYDRLNAVVPAVILSVPMILDMMIYGIAYSSDSGSATAVISALLVGIAAMFIAAKSRLVSFIDNNESDIMYVFIGAGAVCVAAVALAWIVEIIVLLSWWILCIIAFLIVTGIFMGVVFSTAAYTASDGRRQARRRIEKDRTQYDKEEEQQRRYTEYRPRKRETKIYNLDEDDFIDIE